MGLWSVIVAEATTNLITNPSFEVGTTGWAIPGGSIARSTDDPPYGLYNLEVTPSAATTDGVYTTFAATSAVTYTFSVYFKGETGIPYRIFQSNAGFTNISDIETFTGDGEWHRYEVTYTAEATETLYCYITKNSHASTDEFYIDAAQVEAKAYSTSYCDGSIDPPVGFPESGCSWSGVAHASTSTRIAGSRSGGVERDLTDIYGFYVRQVSGVAAPPVENYRTPYALLDGSLREHSRVAERIFTLNGLLTGSSLADLHSNRNSLYQAIKPNSGGDPVIIRYTGTGSTLEISADYEAGLEGGVLNGYTEQVGIRFAAASPNWREVIT